jgi:hypothetical protein
MIVSWIVDRLSERSTWLGLISLATAVGISVSPGQIEAVISAGMAAAGLVAAFTRG